jgi:hypothetical protein
MNMHFFLFTIKHFKINNNTQSHNRVEYIYLKSTLHM